MPQYQVDFANGKEKVTVVPLPSTLESFISPGPV